MDHHASALRAINYPAIEMSTHIEKGQLRASAHTDYGTITILRSDGPGLQVKLFVLIILFSNKGAFLIKSIGLKR